MKKILLVITSALSIVVLTGCGAFQNDIGKAFEGLQTGNYVVTVWSGGLPAATYYVKEGFVNTEKGSDGWFFFVDGKMVRVSGTVTVEQQD